MDKLYDYKYYVDFNETEPYKIVTTCVHPGFQSGLNMLPYKWYYMDAPIPPYKTSYWLEDYGRGIFPNVCTRFNLEDLDKLNPDCILLNTADQLVWWADNIGYKYPVIYLYHCYGNPLGDAIVKRGNNREKILKLVDGNIIYHNYDIFLKNPASPRAKFFVEHIVDTNAVEAVKFRAPPIFLCIDTPLKSVEANILSELGKIVELHYVGEYEQALPNVIKHEVVSNWSDLLKIFHACSVFITVRALNAFSTAAIEAMSMGMPVIVPNTFGWRYFGEPDKYVLKYNGYNDIIPRVKYFLDNLGRLWWELRNNAYSLLQSRYNVQNQLDRWNTFLSSILRKKAVRFSV